MMLIVIQGNDPLKTQLACVALESVTAPTT